MNPVSVLIPTRGRLPSLLKTLASLPSPAPDWLHTVVAVDGDKETVDGLLGEPRFRFTVDFSPRHIGSVAVRNRALRSIPEAHAVLYATDDVLFEPGAIEAAREALFARWPDGDGVIGFAQDRDHHPTGVAMVGPAFVARYPERELFYPGYWHFAAQEVHWLAEKVGRFATDPVARLRHMVDWSRPDKTHKEARQFKVRDMALKEARKTTGEIWGRA